MRTNVVVAEGFASLMNMGNVGVVKLGMEKR
jgi:hypothetical protein